MTNHQNIEQENNISQLREYDELSGEQVTALNQMVIKERAFYESIGLEMISEMAVA